MFKDSLACIRKFVESDDKIRFMWNIGDVVCWECGMLRFKGYWGCGMLGMWDIWDVRHWECGMLGMELLGMRDVVDVECSRWGMLGIQDVGDVGCSGCGMLGVWDVGDVGCLRCGMFRCGMFGM